MLSVLNTTMAAMRAASGRGEVAVGPSVKRQSVLILSNQRRRIRRQINGLRACRFQSPSVWGQSAGCMRFSTSSMRFQSPSVWGQSVGF